MDVRVGLWRRLSTKELCFWTVVLEKTLESPLDCKEIQPVHSEGDQPWDFFGRNDGKAETPVLWPPHVKSWLIGKDSDAGRDWGQEEKGMTEDEMAGWHHWLDGRESEWTPRVGDGQGGLACCDSWGHKESNMTEWLNWTEVYKDTILQNQHFKMQCRANPSESSLRPKRIAEAINKYPLNEWMNEWMQCHWFTLTTQPHNLVSFSSRQSSSISL